MTGVFCFFLRRRVDEQLELEITRNTLDLREGNFSYEDDLDIEFPQIDKFVVHHGLEIYKTLTLFAYLEFGQIWADIGVAFNSVWDNEIGSISKTKSKDVVFIAINIHLQLKK